MSVTILTGDCREVLRTLPDGSVHCVVTSPPYFGLRDYGTAKWEGGDAWCDHAAVRRGHGEHEKQATSAGTSRDRIVGTDCQRCGAVRIDSQLGLEASPAEYIEGMVAVFREVRRVLRKDGTLWLNLGDSYAAARGGADMPAETLAGGINGLDPGPGLDARRGRGKCGQRAHRNATRIGLKHKDLVGIPWMLAFALRADGWYLRQDIIWAKPNPMPESVTDRCTKSHEYLFLLSKSERYYYDSEAIAEAASPESAERYKYAFSGPPEGAVVCPGDPDGQRTRPDGMRKQDGKRNKRSVWTVTTQPFSEAHFATFPPALIEPCILAGCPVGGTVLDPFAGAGTTGLVADRLQRSALLIELNPEYASMAERRIRGDAPLFAEVSA